MKAYEVVLGVLAILAALTVILFTFISKKEGKGLSAAIGGMSSSMAANRDGGNKALFTRMVWCGAICCVIAIVVLGIMTAHFA